MTMATRMTTDFSWRLRRTRWPRWRVQSSPPPLPCTALLALDKALPPSTSRELCRLIRRRLVLRIRRPRDSLRKERDDVDVHALDAAAAAAHVGGPSPRPLTTRRVASMSPRGPPFFSLALLEG